MYHVCVPVHLQYIVCKVWPKENTVFHVLDSTPLLPLLTKVMSLVLAKLNDFMLCTTIVSEF